MNLDASEGCQNLKHATGHMLGQNNGAYTYYFRPKRDVRKLLHEAAKSDPSELQALLESIQIDQYEALFTGRATADFCIDSTYSSIVGDIRANSFPDPDLDDTLLLGTRVHQPMYEEVSCTFVKALRDVVMDLRNYRDSPLLSLLRGTEKKISFADSESITAAVENLNSSISTLDEIRNLAVGIQDSLHDTVGYSYAPSIDIQSSLPSDIERLLQSLALRVSDPLDEGYSGDLSELSLGGANLIYLSLKLLEYELKASTDKVAHFLLIEEPESHIHTHIQKTLFEKYGYSQTQVIVSTHSTHISSSSKIRSVNILAKARQHAVVFHPSNQLPEHQCARIERYLDAVRSTLLFAKGVVLVEGDAELILLPALAKAVLGVSLDELGLSLISMSSAIFTSVAQIFHDDRIRRRCAIITDSDEEFIPLPNDPANDNQIQKHVRASKVSGQQRMQALNAMCQNNNWLKAFYAKHTFEVDFLAQGNANYVAATLDSLYSQPSAIAQSKAAIESKDLAISGIEILRLAKKVGKGWFALQIAGLVDGGAKIPDYILEAIAFSCSNAMDPRTINLILCHRLRHYEKLGTAIGNLQRCLAVQSSSAVATNIQADIAELEKINPIDPLVTLFAKFK